MIQNKNQFEVLVFINQTQGMKFTQRAMASQIKISLGTINQVLSELVEMELLFQNGLNYHISAKGYQALLPYRVKKAIILADGFDQRLLPLTASTPFALATLHGHMIIESILDALMKAQIDEIYIVKGYLGEQFKVLEEAYPNVSFIHNPYDLQTKNSMSLYLAKEHLEQAYIIDGGLYFFDPTIIKQYEYTSCLGVMKSDWCESECFHARKGIAQRMEKGGRNMYQNVGITYLNAYDAKHLAQDLERLMQIPGGKQKDYLEVFFQETSRYQMALKHVSAESFIKISSYQELQRIDINYTIV